jgi:hypothetical protein
VTKWLEGRDTIDHIAQETAQAVIVAMTLAEACGFDLWHAIADEWKRCGTRTWDAVAEIEGGTRD